MIGVVRSFLFSRHTYNALKNLNLQENVFNCEINHKLNYLLCLNIHTSRILSKKKRTDEEKAAQKTGRRSIKVQVRPNSEIIDIWRNMTVSEVANAIKKDVDHVYDAMEFVKDSNNYKDDDSIIDNPEVIKGILRVSGYRFKTIARPERLEQEIQSKDVFPAPPAPEEKLKYRPPVVTVMGHVDHGKTTLLDSLRHTNVVAKEFGGITQHIGAFSVTLDSGEVVTFLDTPGHAAFSTMRARGANITDMVVLVVAADDGVMEQTIESIRMAREANVPIIVAINKIDKPQADIKRTKEMLCQQGIVVEDLGGDVQAVPVSALKGTNLETLVEAIVLQSQIMELKADNTGLVEGVVVETQTDPKRGRLATIIVKRGTLRRGCILVAGTGWARTRVMFSCDGVAITEAAPSMPVQVLGWRELPAAGDEILEVPSEKTAHQVIDWRLKNKTHEKQLLDAEIIAAKDAEHRAIYEKLLEKKRLLGYYRMRPVGPRKKMIIESNHPIFSIVIKGDVAGSVEAILDVLETYDSHNQCKLDIVHYGIGDVSENDLEMAESFQAEIYAFNVSILPQIATIVKKKKIAIKKFKVIYSMIDDLKSEINNRIPTHQEEQFLGEANLLQNFEVDEKRKTVNIAGCRCTRGVLQKDALFRVMRGQEVVFEGKLESMRHMKDEVKSIKKDVECGLKFGNGSVEFVPGDIVTCYKMVDVKRTTDWNPGF